MNLKFISRIEPRVAIISVLALAFIGTVSSMTYGFMLSSRVDHILTEAASLTEVTSGTTTRVADGSTTATRARDGATSGSTRSKAGSTSGTRTMARSGMTSATRAAGTTSGTRTAMRPTSGTQSALRMTSGTQTANSPTSGSRVRVADKSGSRTMAMGMQGRDGMRPGRGPRGGPGGATPATSSLPTSITQMIEQKGLFGRKPQVQQAVALQSILGESAMINGQWIKVGETQGSVKLLELQPNKAIVEFEGKRRELTIWADLPQGG